MKNARLEQLTEFLKNQPGDPFLKYAIATEYLKLDLDSLALEGFERLVAEHPAYLGTYYHLGKLYEKLGKTAEAAETYRQGMEVARRQDNPRALAELRGAWDLISGTGEEDD
ncbi:MAG TPA: tetratricopeptide repeat protein [Anseongella sp.]|nr:tetratricopeptide repeat protein [Anseongella sp.]